MPVNSLRVKDVMTTEVVTVGQNDNLTDADQLMKLKRVRHMPVLGMEGELAGIVSQRDLFHSALLKAVGYGTRGQERLLDMYAVKEAMRTEVETIDPGAPLSRAAELMTEKKIGCLVVMDGARIVRAGLLNRVGRPSP